jgi:CRP/FNR family transcriptional regulator, cyclic AMP receptor protein
MKRFPKGTVLFREGDAGAEMYIIGAGRVEIVKRIAGVEKTVAVLGPGEMLGELALLNQKPRTATAVVLDSLDALVIDSSTLESMLAQNPEFTMRLIRRLADRLDVADGLIRILLHPDPNARELVLKQAEDAKQQQTALLEEMEVQGEVAGDPARVKELFGRLNVLRQRLRESTPDVSEMPRPFSLKARGKGSSGSGGTSGG